tara:strand:- start:7406 stop:7765 length:360 start_codon:yes stop_codon:yes gene_type:complete
MSNVAHITASFTYAVPSLEWAANLAEPWAARRLSLSRLQLAAYAHEQANKARPGLSDWIEDNAPAVNAMLDRAAIMQCHLHAYLSALCSTSLLEAGTTVQGDELPNEIASAFLSAIGQV